MTADFAKLLKQTKHPLVLAVGGGNDSVSTLFLQTQLAMDYQYAPHSVTIVAMLPDCLDYHELEPTTHPLIGRITHNTTRSVQGKTMTAFPEQMLVAHLATVPRLPVVNVFGISMAEGSTGVAHALQHMVETGDFDLVLAIDVGGDFIAVKENIEVLSPMMDGYMLHALKLLEHRTARKIPVLYSVFGLGTDGESTPEMLDKALALLPDVQEGSFDPALLKDVFGFYKKTIGPNRYSRTADFTIREIEGVGHDNPALYRGRFHVKVDKTNMPTVHYGNYLHHHDERFYGKYYLFRDVSGVDNPFAFACSSGVSWFMRVQNDGTRINHELNGQAYMDLGKTMRMPSLSGKSLLFGTPSRKFDDNSQEVIAGEVVSSVTNDVYNMAIIYRKYAHLVNTLEKIEIGNGLLLIGKDKHSMTSLATAFTKVSPV